MPPYVKDGRASIILRTKSPGKNMILAKEPAALQSSVRLSSKYPSFHNTGQPATALPPQNPPSLPPDLVVTIASFPGEFNRIDGQMG